jgi:hypothetical protein
MRVVATQDGVFDLTFTTARFVGLHFLNNLWELKSRSRAVHNACLREEMRLAGASNVLFSASVYVIG